MIETAIAAMATADRPKEVKAFETDIESTLAQGVVIQFPAVWVAHLPTAEVLVTDDEDGSRNLVRDYIRVGIIVGNMRRPGDRRNAACLIMDTIIPALVGLKHATLMGGSPLSYPVMDIQDREIRPKEWACGITLDFAYTEII